MSTNPGYKKKLIEVALPLDEINKQSAREKSIRHGHPSTLHLWWARRPLAACRAVLFAQLVDDPSAHPDKFPTEEDQKIERKRLFEIMERLVNWDNIHDTALYEEARKEIWKSCDGNPPPILDPFAGGGSIPLEAQRLGLEAHASDLNPVAVLINKALIEIPPKWAGRPPVFPGAAEERMGDWPGTTGLAEDVRRYGKWMRDEAEKRIGHLYPKAKLEDGTEANVIAWIWARTVTCPNPACGATMPLISSYWLSKKKTRLTWLEPIVQGKKVTFEIRVGSQGPQEPPKRGRGANFSCLVCGSASAADEVHRQIDEGITPPPTLLAIVAEGDRKRIYLPSNDEHVVAAMTASEAYDKLIADEEVLIAPARGTFGGNAQGRRYGFRTFIDYFTPRQLVALTTFGDMIAVARKKIRSDALEARLTKGESLASGGTEAEAYADAVATYLALTVSRLADYSSTITTWSSNPQNELLRTTFARQALPMTWDYGEGNVFGASSGTLEILTSAIARSIEYLSDANHGEAGQYNAIDRTYGRTVVCTDPPYYDNISYADLADFFYVWLRRSLRDVYPQLFGTLLTPKADELIANPYRQGSREAASEFFESGFQKVFAHIRDGVQEAYPMSVFYAFKQAENDGRGQASTGWETLLEGMIRSGWSVTATWPIHTERGGRSVSIGTNALASSVVLACRPRSKDSASIDRRGFIHALKAELPEALRDLQQGGVAPVDLAQAAIGPGMAVFSRYSQVVEADGSPMRVRAALVLINQMLAEVLSQQEGDFDEDTRFCVKWFEQYAFNEGPYGVAETLSKALNTSVAGADRSGVLRSRAGKVQLLSPEELPDEYDPITDDRISVWEVVMHLAKRLDSQGLEATASLFAAADKQIDLDAAKELTYLLYSICEKKKWAKTALLFNELGMSWPDIERASRTAAPLGSGQLEIDDEGED
jgi:putative DNA methylase